MALAIGSTIENTRLRLVNGPVGQFLQWWGGELRNAMPAPLRERMQYARRRLLMQFVGETFELGIDGAGSVQSLDAISTEDDLQIQQQRIHDLIEQHELAEASRDLLLPESDVLRSDIVMPLATEANLQNALAYEMDRYTPFQADEVFFTWLIKDRDREAGQLFFELFATPREPLESKMEKLKQLGLSPSGVDVVVDGEPLGINLLPPALRHRIVNQQSRVNAVMAVIAVVLMAFVMAQSLWFRENQVEKTTTAIDDVRAEAMAVQQIRKQIDDASNAAGFMQSHKIDNGYKVEVLAELTRILPDDTFLDRLTINAGKTQMQGKSANAQGLIELVNASPFFGNASFRGPTRLDNRTRKEIFDLSANNIVRDEG